MKLTNNNLLNTFLTFLAIYHEPKSIESLTSGLPAQEGEEYINLDNDSKELASNFARVAHKAGLSTQLVEKDLSKFANIEMPAIILLENNSSCILENINYLTKTAKIFQAGFPDIPKYISLESLKNEYIGFSFILKNRYSFDELETSLKEKLSGEEHWFWGAIKYSKTIYKNVLVASVIINLFLLAIPLFTMNVYDRIIPNNSFESLWALFIGVTFILIFDLILKTLRTYFLEFSGKKSDILISSRLFEKVLNIRMDFKPNAVGSFASNLKEFDNVRNFLNSATLSLLVDFPFAIIFLVVTYLIGGGIVIVPLVIMAIIIVYSFLLHKPLHKIVNNISEAAAEKNGFLIETLNNFETLKVMNKASYAQEKWEKMTSEIANSGLHSRTLYSSVIATTSFLIQLNTILVLVIGVYLISSMELTMGGLVATVILTSRAIAPMGQVASLIVNFSEFKTAFKHIDEIMKMPVEKENDKRYFNLENIKGEIIFHDVTFTYPGEVSPILKNVSFTIKAGERVGIIGKNGSGKSTIEKLLIGLYKPDSGYISIDGFDIKDIEPSFLRNQISYVPQEPSLFRGTLRFNLVTKKQNASDSEVIRAAEIGLVDQFAKNHPLGYNMLIGELGYGLSSGQKQAISIARAFIRETPIVLMDEPTNFFDNSVENLFIQRVSNVVENKTTIIVSHKMNVMKLVDRFILLENGRVLEDGAKKAILTKLNAGVQDDQ